VLYLDFNALSGLVFLRPCDFTLDLRDLLKGRRGIETGLLITRRRKISGKIYRAHGARLGAPLDWGGGRREAALRRLIVGFATGVASANGQVASLTNRPLRPAAEAGPRTGSSFQLAAG